jgi:hypothetical protein
MLDWIEEVLELMVGSINQTEAARLERWRSLRYSVLRIAQDSVGRARQEATEFATELIDIQSSFINADYLDLKGRQAAESSEAMEKNVAQLVELTHRYCIIIRKGILDSIPMAIYGTLIEKGIGNLRLELIEKLIWAESLMEGSAIPEGPDLIGPRRGRVMFVRREIVVVKPMHRLLPKRSSICASIAHRGISGATGRCAPTAEWHLQRSASLDISHRSDSLIRHCR